MPVPQTQIVPTEHSLRLYQLTDIIKNKNPELWGFAREQVTSLEQQRSSLQERLKDTSLNVVEKLEIDDQLKHINLYLGEEDIDISDDDVSMLILSSPDFGMPNREQREGLQDLLISTVEAKGPADKSFAVVTGMWEAMKRIDIEPFLIGAMHTATMPKDTPQERKQYEIKAHSKMLRADKLRTKIEAAEQSQKPPNERFLESSKRELAILDDWFDKHPEWKELDPYPESALTPGQAYWKKASDRMIEEAREDLENVSLLDAKTLAFYKWSRTKDLREFMDIFDRGLQLDVIGWNIGRGLGSFIPALTAGVATGLITKSPTTGLAVGRTAMGMMEGSDEFNQAIDYAIQNGLDLDEARHTASHSAIAYGIGSAWMEGWAPGRMIKRMGMTTKKPIRDMLGKMFYDRVNKKSVIKYRNMKSSFGKAMGKVPAFVEGSLTESMQELSQYLYQVSLQAGYQDVGETYLDRYTEIYDPSEAATSFYAGGLLGGAMGTAADVVTQVKKRAVKKAEKLEKRIIELEEKEEDIGIEPEEVYSDDPMQDYLIRMSDIRKEQLAPPAPGEGATALEATIYEQQDAPTSVDKLYGLLQSVEGVKAVKEINKMDDADKSSLLDIVLGYIKKENPKSKVDTREDALKYLQAFAQGGKRVTTAKRIGLEEPVISAKTKFDPSKMAPSLREDMAKFGLPKDVYKMPPPAVAPITKKAPPISKKPTIPKEPIIPKGPPIIEAPPITEAPPIREEPPIPTEPTPAQLAKMAAAKKPAVAPSVKPEVVTKPVQELVDKLPLQKGQKEKLKRGYKWFAIGVGETVKGKFVEERIVRAQGKEIKLKGSPKNLTWFVNRGYDGLWRVTNVETGKSISSLGFGDTIKAAIGFAESEISSPQNIERLKEIVPTSQFAKETGMIKPEVAPPVTPIKAPSVEYQDVIVSKKQDRIVGAQADYKNNRILVSKKDLQKKFKEKAWTKPKVKGVDPLPKDAFKTYEEWEDFAIAHERAHFTQENRAIKNLAERENDANRIALGEIAAVAPPVTPIKAPPVVKALTDVKAYMQNRRKLDEEPSNIVYNAKQSRLTLKYGSNAEIQKEISRLDTLIPLIEKNPTEYIPRKGFWQRGDSIEKRLARLKDIKNQLVDKLKAPAVVKVTPEDVHKAAEAVGMAWDDDAAFMALSKRVTGKDRIDDMTSGERASLIDEISKEAPAVIKGKTVVESYDSATQKTTVETQDKKTIKLYRGSPSESPIFEDSKVRGVYGFIDRDNARVFGDTIFEFEYNPDKVLVTNSQLSGITYLLDKIFPKTEQDWVIGDKHVMKVVTAPLVNKETDKVTKEARKFFPELTEEEIYFVDQAYGPREIYGDYPEIDYAIDKMFAVLAKKVGYDAAKFTEVPTAKQWEIAMKGYEPEPAQYVIFGDVGKIIKSPEPPVTKPPVKAKKVPVVKKPVVKKVEKSLPMNFVYGEGTALPARPDVKSKTTFDAILAGERRSTSRKDNSLNKLGVGSIIEFYAKGRKERIKAIVTQKWVPAKVIGPERWSKLEGYDEAAVKENWTSGKKLSEYVQIEFEVLEPAIARPTKPEVPKIAKPTGERKTSGEATKNLRGIKFEFDEPLLKRVMKAMPSIAEDPELYDKIAKRLIKRIPFVIPRAALERGLKESFEYYGGDPKFLGRAFGVAVEWSAERAKVSTPPHEFFHPYFKVMGSAPIIRLAVQRFKNLPEVKSLHKRPDIRNDKDAVEEYLAQFVGPMYVKRTLATVPAKVKAWFRRFWLTLKKMFVPLKLTAKDLRTIIFEEFYRGLTPGMTAEEVSSMVEALDKAAMVQSEQYDIYDEAASHVEPVSEDGSKEGVSQEYDYRASSLIHYNTYFSESFDRYINKKHHGEMAYLAVINKEAGFNSFFEELKIWANENLLDKDGVGVDIDKIYTRQEKNYLIQFFVKSNSRIKVYDKELDRDTTGKRVYLDLFVIDPESPDFKEAKAAGQKPHEFKFTVSESEELGNNENNRRKRSSYKTSSFVELQNKARVIYLPHNNIVKVVANKKYVKADEQEAIELGKEYKHPREFVFPANMRINGGHIRRWDEIFAEDHQYEGDDLLFIAGVKGSTDGAIFMGKVSDEFTGMDEEGFRSYLDGEVDKGFMTQPQSDKMVEEISSYFLTNNQIYSQQVGKHEWWKNIKGSNYLLRLRKGKPVGIREHFNRLRIDFAEGTIPFGLGDTGIMLFDPEEITLKIDGKNISLKAYAGTYKFDGWLMSSGQFFKDLSNVIGRRAGLYENKMHEAKTMIRHLSDDLVDYLGLKMMQMTPYEGMEFFRDGEKFAEVKVRRGETVFVETATGEEFHHLGSIEEAKMLAGKFDRDTEHGGLSDEDGFYKVNTLGEQDIKVLFVTPEKSKENSAYPVAEGDLTLDPDLAGNPDYEKFMTALNAHYKNVGDVWIEDLFNMHDNPRILRDAIYKPVTAGAIPTELQEIVELLGPTGVGLHLPYVMSIAESYLNNIFINDGLNKVRQMNGMSTNLKLKPRIGGIKGTVGVSASNSVVFDRAKKLYIESEIVLAASQITTFEDEGVQIAIDEFEGKPLSEQIDSINEVLKRRPIYAKFSRQPVTGSTVTIMRKINELTVGHGKIGEVVFMSEEDIFKIQADYDGDSVSLEMFDNSQVEKAFIEWQETDTFKARDKTAYTNVFLTKKKHTLMTTYKDFLLTVSDITVASNSQGVVTNSKVIGNILAYKEFKLKMKGDKGKLKDVTFEAVSPSEVVVMDYAPLDKESLMEKEFELFNLLNEQGDSVVTLVKGKFKEVTADEIPDIKTKLYLRTTHEHEMTNLLQLAVDDVGLGLLSKIGYNFNMLIGRMFKRSDNGRISGKGVLHVLKAARQMFNYSPTRRGVVSGEKASMDQNIVESIRINHLLESSSLERNTLLMNNLNGRSSVDHPEWVPWYRGFEVTSVSVNDKSTPTETLLTMLAKEYDKRVNSIESGDQFVAEWGGSPGTYTEATYRIAHVNAMKKLEEQWSTLAAKRGVTNAEMESGTRLMSKIDKDFRAIFKDVKKTRPGKFVRLKPEYHKPLRELIDNYIDDWNKLEDNSQMYATLYFLSGTATRDRAGKPALRVDVRRFLPLNLMHNGMWKTYAQLHWEMMMKDMNSKFKQPIDSRGETYKGFKFGKALALAKKKSEDMCG